MQLDKVLYKRSPSIGAVNKKLPTENTSEYVLSDKPEYSIIQHLSSPVGDRLKKFYCNMKKIWILIPHDAGEGNTGLHTGHQKH